MRRRLDEIAPPGQLNRWVALTMRPFLLLTLIVIASSAVHSQCLKCDPNEVTLTGTVYAKDFPGPPNYESIRRGDERMRYWIVLL